jgi:hypothetical protein
VLRGVDFYLFSMFRLHTQEKNAVKDFTPTETVESGPHILSWFLVRNEGDLWGA